MKTCQLKCLDLVELYNFDIKFVFIRDHMKKLWIYFPRDHLQRLVRTSPAHRNPFLRAGDIITRIYKWEYFQKWVMTSPAFPSAGDDVTRSWKSFSSAGLAAPVPHLEVGAGARWSGTVSTCVSKERVVAHNLEQCDLSGWSPANGGAAAFHLLDHVSLEPTARTCW
jgi:hypothetical protein